MRLVSEVHDLGLGYVHFELVGFKSLLEFREKTFGLVLIVKTEDYVIGIPNHLLEVGGEVVLEPQIEDIVQEDVGQERADD